MFFIRILNKKKEVLFRLESSPIAVDIVYQGRGSDISSSDYRIFAVTYIKSFESELPSFLRRRKDNGPWYNTEFENIDELQKEQDEYDKNYNPKRYEVEYYEEDDTGLPPIPRGSDYTDEEGVIHTTW